MSKDKKKSKKHQSFHQAIKPFIQDTRVFYSVLGALGAGVVLGATLGSEKGGALIERITAAVKEWGQPTTVADKKIKPAKENKPTKQSKPTKLKKPAKPFATEHTRGTANI